MMTISTRNLKNLRQLRYTLLYKCNCIYICFYIYMYTYSLLHLKSHPIRPLPFNIPWTSENRVSKSKIEFPAPLSIYSFSQTIHVVLFW